MASIGCNLVGDQLYVKSKKTSLKGLDEETKAFVNAFPRQALHAASLGFVHPRSGEKLQFSCGFPDDYLLLLDKLCGSRIEYPQISDFGTGRGIRTGNQIQGNQG